MQIAVFSPHILKCGVDILKCLQLWLPCQCLWEWTKLTASRLGWCLQLLHPNIWTSTAWTGVPIFIREWLRLIQQDLSLPSFQNQRLVTEKDISDILNWQEFRREAFLLCPGWMGSAPESRTHWGGEMHTHHVTWKSEWKEKPDLQPSVQRLFYMQKSSWTQLLFSLIETKQR